MKFAIIAVGYNRPDSMERLLSSICDAYYESDKVDLIVSIDRGKRQKEIVCVAEKKRWKYGDKIIRAYEKRQGLRSHILQCGDLTEKYDVVVVLEDDLLVSPYYFSYVIQAVTKFSNDDRIAGVSLYKHVFHPGANRPFEPEHNGYDAFLMQFAQSWGQCWTKSMWKSFRAWYKNNHNKDLSRDSLLPEYITRWNQHSWLKYYMRYIVEKNKYFVYPTISLSTNVSEVGQHCSIENSDYQVPLLQGKMKFRFPSFENAVKYDVYFDRMEIGDVIFPELKGKKILDLYGIRNNYQDADYIFSINELPYKKIKKIALIYRPIERNCMFPQEGKGIYLYDLKNADITEKSNIDVVTRYDVRGVSWKCLLHLAINDLLSSMKEKLIKK